MNKVDLIRRGQIVEVDFGNPTGCEQGGIRPAIVIQNDIGNKYSPTVIVCPITSKINSKRELPTHILISDFEKAGLNRLSQVLAEQIATKDKSKITKYIGTIDSKTMERIDKAIEVSVQVGQNKLKRESQEVKYIKQKVKDIEQLDEFIKMWFSYNSDSTPIMKQMSERETKIKALVKYANDNNIDYKEYYNLAKNNNRMVG